MNKPDLYKAAGVDTTKGDELVDWLQQGQEIRSPVGQVVAGIGGFAGLFKPNFSRYKEPLLVASTDGVGTKLLLGIDHDQLEGLGTDLVAMCVNDLYCVGARPLFFVDYYATGHLDEKQFKHILTGIRRALSACQTPLLGGETAELPGLYRAKHFDLAGFVVGVVDNARQLGPHLVREGDVVVSLPSNGFHSNGYSLVRRWLSQTSAPSSSLIAQLLTPTLVYHQLPDLWDTLGPDVMHAVANITGGGISGNLPRVLPDDMCAVIKADNITMPDWMRDFILAHTASLMDVEPVFNLGCGMLAVIAQSAVTRFMDACRREHIEAVAVGHIAKKQAMTSAGVQFI